jgi:splicing factor U2AF subunit
MRVAKKQAAEAAEHGGTAASAEELAAALANQQTRHARRLYVGGIPSTTEQEVAAFFNDIISRALHAPGQEFVIDVFINHERRFAFVELKGVELTSECMRLDGMMYKDSQLKIRRPNDYDPAKLPPPSGQHPTLDLSVLGMAPAGVPDSPNKLFIGGLPPTFTDEQVQMILQAVGPLRAFQLVRDASALASRGYGFAEYADPAHTDIAIEKLDGQMLGDKPMIVRRAVAQTTAAPGAAAPSAVSMLSQPQLAMQPSTVAVFRGVLLPESAANEELRQRVQSDMESEAGKFGTVKKILVGTESAAGRVFVEWEDMACAMAAVRLLTGRTYGGRAINGETFPVEDWVAERYA